MLICHRNPADTASLKDRCEYYVNLAKIAEKGKITSIFLTDGYGNPEVYESSSSATMIGGGGIGQLDPMAVIAPMAMATKSVGLTITASSSYLRMLLPYFCFNVHPNKEETIQYPMCLVKKLNFLTLANVFQRLTY